MPILNIVTSQVGQVGLTPHIVYISTNDPLGTVLGAGYLNLAVQNGATFREDDMALVSTKTSHSATATQVAWLELSYSPTTGWSLVSTNSPGSVTLPTIANHIATYTDTNGGLGEDATIAINGGSLQAGLSGTAGYLASFPATAAKGSLKIVAVANTGNTLVTISNALHGQASTYSIPDSGLTTASFIVSGLTGTQHITVGSLAVDAGTVTSGISSGGQVGSFVAFPTTASKGSLALTALVNATGNFSTTISNALAVAQSQVISIPDSGLAASSFLLTNSGGTQTIATGSLALSVGTLTLGSSGNASSLTLFPGTAANGTLRIVPVNAGGAFNTTLSNGVMGQSTVYTVPDILAATGGIVVSTTAVRMQAVPAAAVAGGAASQVVVDAFCTAGSTVVANWNTSANLVGIQKITPGVGSFTVLSSGDPGASTLNYIIMK